MSWNGGGAYLPTTRFGVHIRTRYYEGAKSANPTNVMRFNKDLRAAGEDHLSSSVKNSVSGQFEPGG
jgi:hypothetical protein